MKLSAKKLLQGTAVVSLFLCYTTLVISWPQKIAKTQDGEPPSSSRFQERAPRSISDNSVDYYPGQVLDVTPGRSALLKNRKTQLDDVFISVKTTGSFHQSRLAVILRTWFVLAREQTYFFTDSDDRLLQTKTNGHLVNTNCSSSHNRKALCCKMSVEIDAFLESNKKWFCHFDDDNYVNVPRLVKLLQKYNPQEDWYLGKPSIRAPLEIYSKDNPQQKISFWFATGGAGFCVSRALALKMMPFASGGRFISIGEKIRLPDDVTMGYIIEHLLRKKLTVAEEFHSHLEPMRFLKPDSYADQITFSYSKFGKEMNVLAIDGIDPRIDPTRRFFQTKSANGYESSIWAIASSHAIRDATGAISRVKAKLKKIV